VAAAALDPGQLGGAVTAHYPPVFFREDWKYDASVPNQNNEREPEHTIVQGDVKNPNLEVRLYGDKAGTRTVIQPYNEDITYVMSLLCTSNWAITLRDKNNDVDLSGLATIKWRTRVSGFHLLRPILKLANGTWLIGDKAVGLSTDWVESEIQLYDVRWRNLDIEKRGRRARAQWVDNPDLSSRRGDRLHRLDAWSRPRLGGGSRVDWIQVTGQASSASAASTPASLTTQGGSSDPPLTISDAAADRRGHGRHVLRGRRPSPPPALSRRLRCRRQARCARCGRQGSSSSPGGRTP
jgi:hypothetical protein